MQISLSTIKIVFFALGLFFGCTSNESQENKPNSAQVPPDTFNTDLPKIDTFINLDSATKDTPGLSKTKPTLKKEPKTTDVREYHNYADPKLDSIKRLKNK